LEIEKTIEKIKILKSELDGTFEEGKIDLDRISAGLESAVADLEPVSGRLKREDHRPEIETGIGSSIKCAGRRPSFRVEDFR
jgi:hypothetical protein